MVVLQWLLCFFLSVFYVLEFIFFFKQKTAYEMRISDWSSDVCSSDLGPRCPRPEGLTNDRLSGARHYSVTDQTAGKAAHCQHRPASDYRELQQAWKR